MRCAALIAPRFWKKNKWTPALGIKICGGIGAGKNRSSAEAVLRDLGSLGIHAIAVFQDELGYRDDLVAIF